MAYPPNFFGLHILHTPNPINVPFQSYRFLGNNCRWFDLNTSSGSFNFAPIDTWLNIIRSRGVYDVLFELGGCPVFCSSLPTNACNPNDSHTVGTCAPPSDLNSDGTGANLYWRQWIKAVGQHFAANSDILVSGWCAWNEPYNSISWTGTHNQLVRLSQDARAILFSRGSITATGETAAQAQATVGLSGPVYNVSGSIMLSPSLSDGSANSFSSAYLGTAGATDAAEVIAYHASETSGAALATNIANFKAILSSTNLAKPFWITETSWYNGVPSPNAAQAVLDMYNVAVQNAARIYWYAIIGNNAAYENSDGSLTPAGVSYKSLLGGQGSTTYAANIDDIQPLGKNTPRWKAPCYLPSCNPGGSGRPTYNSQSIGHSTPSLDGASMQFSMTGPPDTNILWVLIAGYNNLATNFTNDFHIWIPTDSKGLVGSYEIDMFLFSSTDNVEYMFGTQWNEASGKWQIWDQLHGHWIYTSVTAGLTLGNWTHVQQAAHRIAGDTKHMYFDYVIIDGITYWYSGTPGVSVQQPAGPGFTTGEVGIQFQVDLWSGGSGGNITYYIDQASFTAAPATGQTAFISDSVTFGENLSTQGNSNSAYIYDNASFSDYLTVNGQGGGEVTNVDDQPTIPSPVFNPIVVVEEE